MVSLLDTEKTTIIWNTVLFWKEYNIHSIVEDKKKWKTLTTSSNSSDGETGGLSVPVKEPTPFKGSLLWDSLPDVSGDTSC